MGRSFQIPYRPVGSILGEEEVQAVREAILAGGTLSCGRYRDRFEQEFAAFTGVRHAISCTNCTVALELATSLVGLRSGDEVIATPLTYQATIEPLLTLPVVVKFCDVDPNSLNIDPLKLADLISPKTRAIYLVHYGGLMADMDPVMDLARRHGAVVIEDAAHALGSRCNGTYAGAAADFGCFSFQSMKNMTTLGEGGMLTVARDEWAENLRLLRGNEPLAKFVPRDGIRFGRHAQPARNLNRHDKNAYTHDCVELALPGTNATLSEPAASVGSVQLRKVNGFNGRRRQIAQRLDAGLSRIPGIRVQRVPEGYTHVYHLYTFFVEPDSGLDRDEFGAALEDEGVEIHLRYFPLHLLPEWRHKGHGVGECPVTERSWFEQQMNLPCYPSLRDEQVDFMIEAAQRAASRVRRQPGQFVQGSGKVGH